MNIKLILLAHLCCLNSTYGSIWLDPDTGLNIYDFLYRHGYQFYENHTIVTQDDYILTTVRIPRGKHEPASNQTKPVVLLLHGITSNPQDLILKGDSSIGFKLVEQGFDVFLMASRGNTYSRDHKTLSIDSVAYWNFSWHEIGYYDIPANMDYIIELTGVRTISFIGHSQGGTAFVAFAATRPEYRARITMTHLFAPIVYMDGARLAFFDVVRDFQMEIEEILTKLKLNKGVLTYKPLVTELATVLCNRDSPALHLCIQLLAFSGPDPLQLNSSQITVIASNDPAGGSVKELLHYLQVAKSSKFRLYDYRLDNVLIYNQSEPPPYNLTCIDDIPIYIWYGINDYFSGVSDFQRLIGEIPSAREKRIAYTLWNHIDFVFAIDAPRYVYEEAISIMMSYL